MANLLDCNNVRRDGRLQIILRASKPASLKYHSDPKYVAKPIEYYVKEDGTYTSDITLARLEPLKLSTKDIYGGYGNSSNGERRAPQNRWQNRLRPATSKRRSVPRQGRLLGEAEGILRHRQPRLYNGRKPSTKSPCCAANCGHAFGRDGYRSREAGTPLKIDGKTVFSDVDPQNAFEIGANGAFAQASTDQTFQDWINGCLGSELVMHGGEGWYRGLPKPSDPKG